MFGIVALAAVVTTGATFLSAWAYVARKTDKPSCAYE